MTNKRAVLVTGGARGIGRSISEHLAENGWMVIATFNTGREEAMELRRTHGVEVRHLNMTDRSASLGFARQIRSEFTLDALVNNAGILEKEGFEEFTLGAWDRALEVNVTAPLILAQELGRHMGTGGSIVNIASTDADIGSFRSIGYSASKAALLSITRSLANILGPRGVRVNAVTPGWVDNGITADSYEAANLTPLGRNGAPGDIAKVVAFLLSPEAAFITGASIVTDGGYSCVDYYMQKENDLLG
ncbi:SDR family NAD(P)-dependent oxidoreductase [Arthrobacter sp. PsM3]|uniref:SDR family NAD(P)-dependent oxidoreductase n=1 Tax=Arthrobacter sp. PsM3 TaxID=3030531 RepID=UPI00263A6007|nr:SDR family oxidoreductase [Arthrobacter sp. PsM3]MDN4645234.1 SDR family oxidoreductase [Arthrobacter sp. PsM3]